MPTPRSTIAASVIRRACAASLLVTAFAFAAPVSAQQPIVMKMTGIAVNDPAHHYMNRLKEKIEARTGGRIKGEVYPGAQLGGFPQMIQGTQLGTIEFMIAPPGFLRGLDPRVQIADAPGLFQDMAHGHKTLNDPRFRDKFLDLTTAKGMQGVMIWNVGPTTYSSVTPLRKLDDFRGKKFRVLASKVEIESMARLGATGMPLDFSEVIVALQSKVLDGARSSIVVMAPMKFYTVAKYLTTVSDTMIPVGCYASKIWLDKLPADLRQAVIETSNVDVDWLFEASVAANQHFTKVWAESGGEVIALPPADQAEFMKRVSAVAEEVYGKDPVLGEMYNLFKQVAESHRK